MKALQKTIEWLIYIFIFLLPWQTRLIYKIANYKNEFFEYQSQSLYATEILFLVIILLIIIYYFKKIQIKNILEKISQKKFYYFTITIAITAAFFILNNIFSQNPAISFYKTTHLIGAAALAVILIFFSYNFKKLSWAIISAGLFQSILAINQFFEQKIIANKWLGIAGQDPQILGTSVIETSAGRFLRAYGALPHPNILAGFLVIVLLFIIYQYFTETAKKKTNIILTTYIIVFTALLMTFSRSAWLALFISIIFIFLMAGVKKDLWQKYKTQINKIIATTLLIAIAFSLVKSDLMLTRFQMQERLEVKSVAERISGYGNAWQILKQNALFGTGLGNYTLELSKLHPDWPVWNLQPVHNVFLLALIELGLLILVLLIALTIIIVKNLFKFLKGKWFNIEIIFSLSIIIALISICFFDHFLWSFYFGNMLLAFVGLIIKFSNP